MPDDLNDQFFGSSVGGLTPQSNPPFPAVAPNDLNDQFFGEHAVASEPGSEYVFQGGPKTWEDTTHALAAGAYAGVVAPFAGAMSRLSPTDEGARGWYDTAKRYREKAEASEAAMTPTARTQLKSPGLNMTWVEEQAAPMAIMAGPAIAASTVGAPGLAVAGIAGGVGGFLGGGQTASDVQGAIDKAPVEALMKVPEFAKDIERGASEDDARYNLSQRALDETHAAAIGAALGLAAAVAGPVGELAGVGPSRLLGTQIPRLVQIALGVGEGAGTIGVQMGGQTYAEQSAEHAAGIAPAPTFGGTIKSLDPRMLGIAGVLGGVGAGLHYHPGIDDAPREGSAVAPKRAAEGGVSGNAVGSPRDYEKTKEKVEEKLKEPVAKVVDALANQPAAPPPSQEDVGVGPAEAAAAAASEMHPVTRGVNQPEVAQGPTVQPRVETAQDQQGRPLTGNEPAPLPTPQRPPESQPAAGPAPAARVPETPLPEPPSVLQQQHAALHDPNNPREAMVYPPGTQPFDITGKRYGQTELPDGRTVQFDRLKASDLNEDKVQELARTNRLNDLLQMGPVNKDEAIQRSVAGGERPVVTAEHTAAGIPVKEAAGTTATAPAQAAAMEATKTPGSTIVTKTPEQMVAERLQGDRGSFADRFGKAREELTQQSKAEAPVSGADRFAEIKAQAAARQAELEAARAEKLRVRSIPVDEAKKIVVDQTKPQLAADRIDPETRRLMEERQKAKEKVAAMGGEKLPEAGARVLRAQDAGENMRAAAQAASEKAAIKETKADAKKIAAKEARAEAGPQPGKKGPDEKAPLIRQNEIAKEVVAKAEHAPGAKDGLALDPSQPGGKGARKELLDRVRGMVADAEKSGYEFGTVRHRLDPETRHANEAVLLHEARLLGNKKVVGASDIRRFLENEEKLNKNGEKGYSEVMQMRRETGREKAVDLGKPTKEIATEGVEGGEVGGIEHPEKPDVAEEIHAAKERIAEEKVAREPGVKRVTQRQEIRSPEEIARLNKVISDLAKRKAELTQAEEPAAKGPSTITTTHQNGTDVEIKTNSESTVNHLLSNIDYQKFSPELRPMARALVDKITNLIGDMPVYWISRDEMKKTGPAAYGAFISRQDHILMNSDDVHPDGRQTTAIHEAIHAAVSEMYLKEPEFRAILDQLRDEAVGQWKENLDAARGFTGPELNAMSSGSEFLSELMSNPRIQAEFKKLRISSDLAKKLDIPRYRKASLWTGLLTAIANHLGLPPRYVSVIEAGMAATEQGMHGRDVGETMRYAGRWEKAGKGELGPLDKIAGFRPKRETNADILKEMGPIEFQKIADKRDPIATPEVLGGAFSRLAPDVAKRVGSDMQTNLKYWWQKGRQYLLSPTQIEGLHGKLFDDGGKRNILMDMNNAMESQHQNRVKLNEADQEFLSKSYQLSKKYSYLMNDFGKLLDYSGKYGIHADKAGPEITNPVKASMENWQAVEHGPATRAMLEAIRKEAPELADHYTDLKEFYRDKAVALGNDHLTRITDAFDPVPKKMKDAVERNERVQRVLDHKMTDEDRTYYSSKGILPELDKAYGMTNRDGVYFNAYRDGDKVVTGRYDMPGGGAKSNYSGELLPDDTREFDTRDEAHAFATGTQMHATPSIVNYVKDPDNPGKFVSGYPDTPDTREVGKVGKPIRAADADEVRYQVKLQREHTEMHRTAAQAERARQQMLDMGVKDVSAVLDKRREENWSRITSANEAGFKRRVEDLKLPPVEEQKMIEMSRHLALMSQSGNRMDRYWTTRRNIAGANYHEIYEAAHNYSDAANYHMANSRALPEISKAMDRLEAHELAHRGDEKNGYLISAIANTFKDRVYGGPDMGSTRTPGWMRALMTLSFAKYLLTPRFIIQHQLHPLAFTAPQMAGRHGYINSVGYLRAALSDVGGNIPNIWEGMKTSGAMAKALMGYGDLDAKIAAAKPLNMTDRIIAKVGAGNGREGDAMRELQRRGRLASGFDDELYGASGLDKVNILMRQTTGAMEATNRSVAGLASYRVEYDRQIKEGKSSQTAHEKAIEYATNTIDRSMGVFSPTNMAQMFKHPYMKGMMQFKQFPLQQTYSFMRNVYEAFKDESPEVRREAARSAITQMASAAVMTGAGGLPLVGVLKAGGLLTAALGITPMPSQMDDRMRRGLADHTSPGIANAFFDGPLSMLGSYAPDVSSMFGYSGDFFYGEPHNNDWKSYLWDQVAGAPGSTLGDSFRGAMDMYNGDYMKGAAKLAPIGLLANFARGYTLGTEGATTSKGLPIMPASPVAAGFKMLGITTQAQSRAYAGRTALEEDLQESKQEKQSALDQARKGSMADVIRWNAANPADRISPSQVQHAKRGMTGETILGVKETPKNRARLQEFQRTYQ